MCAGFVRGACVLGLSVVIGKRPRCAYPFLAESSGNVEMSKQRCKPKQTLAA